MVNNYFGRLTNDVILESVGNGKKVINNRIAMRQGKNATAYIDITAWDKTAELIYRCFKKGYEILFQGLLLNKKKFLGNGVEIDVNYLLIEEVFFTNGNPKSDMAIQGDQEDDFLK